MAKKNRKGNREPRKQKKAKAETPTTTDFAAQINKKNSDGKK